jgi:hypothetical protein
MRRFLRRVRLRRRVLRALAKSERHGSLCEKHAPAALTNDRKQRRGGSPVLGVLFVAGQAYHVLDGIAQRHKRLAFTWYGNRFEKL